MTYSQFPGAKIHVNQVKISFVFLYPDRNNYDKSCGLKGYTEC